MNTETAGHDSIRLIVKRQEGPNAKPHWEEFSVAHQPHMNVVSALMEIRKNPVNAQGKPRERPMGTNHPRGLGKRMP